MGFSMLERSIYQDLINWKNKKDKKSLVVYGARQVGKTYIIKEFGKNEYKSFIYINFMEHPEYKNIFNSSLSSASIYEAISLRIKDIALIDHDTLIFLDEIQECPQARTALKFLTIDNRYDVIASGSLLGLSYRTVKNFPVGYEEHMKMDSLSFYEFLLSQGYSKANIDMLKSHFISKEKIDVETNKIFTAELRKYITIGGMPEVVNTYLKTHNHSSVYAIQQDILDLYQKDMTTYTRSSFEKNKIINTFNAIPTNLANENKKFKYSTIAKKASKTTYENAINWLIDADYVTKVNNLKCINQPLLFYANMDYFKLYLNDIGLLSSLYGFYTKQLIIDNKIQGPSKGAIYENLIFDILNKNKNKLFYYKKENSTQKIEFILENKDGIIPIEVKSGNNSTTSLNNFIKEINPKYSYKLIDGNVSLDKETNKITLPHYMAMFIKPNE